MSLWLQTNGSFAGVSGLSPKLQARGVPSALAGGAPRLPLSANDGGSGQTPGSSPPTQPPEDDTLTCLRLAAGLRVQRARADEVRAGVGRRLGDGVLLDRHDAAHLDNVIDLVRGHGQRHAAVYRAELLPD